MTRKRKAQIAPKPRVLLHLCAICVAGDGGLKGSWDILHFAFCILLAFGIEINHALEASRCYCIHSCVH